MAEQTLKGWTRTHKNGHTADVREWPGADGYFGATAWPPPDSGVSSLPLSVERDEERARRHADQHAHPGCTNPDACAGPWVSYSLKV